MPVYIFSLYMSAFPPGLQVFSFLYYGKFGLDEMR